MTDNRGLLVVLLASAGTQGSCGSEEAGGSGVGGGPDGSASCVPGQQVACPCGAGSEGLQVCNADGTAFGACMCGSAGAGVLSAMAAVTSGSPAPRMAVNGSHVYWTNASLGAVMRVAGSGGATETLASSSFPGAIAVDAKNVYWGEQGGIFTQPKPTP